MSLSRFTSPQQMCCCCGLSHPVLLVVSHHVTDVA